MASTVLLRVIYSVAIAGLLISGMYLLGFQFLWRQCSPDSHWVTYSGEEITDENFFGPGTKLLSLPARDLMVAGIPSLYKSLPGNHRRTIRMVEWGTFPYAAAVLEIVENRNGGFEAHFTIARVDWNDEPDEMVLKITENRSWPLNRFRAEKLREHLSAGDAWQGCKDLDFWRDGVDHAGVFIIEESTGGRYRMLVQASEIEGDLGEYNAPDRSRWYWRSHDFFVDITGGGWLQIER